MRGSGIGYWKHVGSRVTWKSGFWSFYLRFTYRMRDQLLVVFDKISWFLLAIEVFVDTRTFRSNWIFEYYFFKLTPHPHVDILALVVIQSSQCVHSDMGWHRFHHCSERFLKYEINRTTLMENLTISVAASQYPMNLMIWLQVIPSPNLTVQHMRYSFLLSYLHSTIKRSRYSYTLSLHVLCLYCFYQIVKCISLWIATHTTD